MRYIALYIFIFSNTEEVMKREQIRDKTRMSF